MTSDKKAMTKLLLKNGRLLDLSTQLDETADIFIKDGKIVEIGSFEVVEKDVEVIDATDKLVIPGVIDLHVHLRDLEQMDKESIATGTAAAVAGGVTTVLCMPNTVPRLDSATAIKRYQKLIGRDAKCHVMIAGAISQNCEGKALADIDAYPKLGIRVITDDGFDVDDQTVLEAAFKKAAQLDLIVMVHPEVMNMPGVINEGVVSKKLGVPGQPNEKEWRAVERAIKLATKTGARMHLTHLTTKQSVTLVRDAKRKTDRITCDVTPHHLMLTEDVVLKLGSLAKVNPPLRTEEDRQALLGAVKDGTIDCIVTDHAPHEESSKGGPASGGKNSNLIQAAFGFSGLETLVSAVLTELYFKQKLPLMRVIELLTDGPNHVTGWDQRALAPGHVADLTIIDLNLEKTVDRFKLISKGKNSPFHGMKLKGWPILTLVSGKIFR